LDHANGGETFSPTQFALPAVLLACFFGIGVPSLKAGDVKVNGSAAKAICVTHHVTIIDTQTSKRLLLQLLALNIAFSSFWLFQAINQTGTESTR